MPKSRRSVQSSPQKVAARFKGLCMGSLDLGQELIRGIYISRTPAESKRFAHLLLSSSSQSTTIIENLQTATSLVPGLRGSYWRSATAEMIGGVVIVLAKPLLGRRYFITITMLRLAISETQCITGVKTWTSKLFLLGKGEGSIALTHVFYSSRRERSGPRFSLAPKQKCLLCLPKFGRGL